MKPELQPQDQETVCLWILTASSSGTLRVQRTYNVTAMTFTPAELAAAIKEHLPGFNVQYLPDFREGIARSWPTSINDDCARRDWGWAPRYDLQAGALDVIVRPPAELEVYFLVVFTRPSRQTKCVEVLR